MRIGHFFMSGAAALIVFASGSAIIAQPRRAPPTAPLYPLSERDLSDTQNSGCECMFRMGRRTTLFRIIEDELTIRTSAGRQVCRISDEQFSAISDGEGAGDCAGIRMSVRRTGPLRVIPEADSADGPAVLTLTQGETRRTLSGNWGCAC